MTPPASRQGRHRRLTQVPERPRSTSVRRRPAVLRRSWLPGIPGAAASSGGPEVDPTEQLGVGGDDDGAGAHQDRRRPGASTIAQRMNTPAARGMATTLYPAPQTRFWTILR